MYGKGGAVGTESLDLEVPSAQSLIVYAHSRFISKPSQDSAPASLDTSNYGGTSTNVVVKGTVVSIMCFFGTIVHQYDLGLTNSVVAVSFF